MPGTQEFRRRIRSAQNTKQITRAMEMVSSVKMQKAVKTALASRPYTQSAWHTLEILARITSPEKHLLLNPASSNHTAIIVVSSDKGLCGSFNSSILQKTHHFIKDNLKNSHQFDIISVGKKGSSSLKNLTGSKLLAEFADFGKDISYEETLPISKLAISDYLNGKYDKIVIIYTHFISTLKQSPVLKQVLPITKDHLDLPELWAPQTDLDEKLEYAFEPNPDAVLDALLNQFIRLQIFGAIKESNASEHSTRMVAMKNATDSAKDLIDDLTLTYNTIRQNSITSEIAEISSASEAMK